METTKYFSSGIYNDDGITNLSNAPHLIYIPIHPIKKATELVDGLLLQLIVIKNI